MVKGLDYYEALGLTRNANDIEIRRAYRRLALKSHPNINDEEAAKGEFCRVGEAYDVLSDPQRKGVYDLYGEDILKDGRDDGTQGMKGGIFAFDPDTSPAAVFERFFGTNNPYEALDGIANQFEAMTTAEKPKTGKNRVYTVELSLEEIYHGCLKKVVHTRKVLHSNMEQYTEEVRHLTIDVKPGMPGGTRFVFEGEGNKTPKKEPGPVVFVLKALPHPRFSRRGAADLVHKVVLPLYQALVSTSVDIKTLDNRTLTVPVTDIVTPGYTLTVPGEGMPKPGGGGGRGNLVLEAQLLFPNGLTELQKVIIKSAFFLPPVLATEQAKAVKAYENAFKDNLHGWATGFAKDVPLQ